MNFFQIFGFGKNKAMRPQDFTSDEAKAAAAWIETVNPLRGMTSQRMQNLYDASRAGDTVHLQWLYQEIEKVDPTLLICQQRRTGALASLDWHISTRNKKRTRSFDEKLAQEQADCLELAFGDADQANFNEAVEHLARGFFRGFAHVLPRWSADGLSLKGFDCLDQWNFVRDVTTGTWYWNPEAHAYTGYADCRPIPPGELVVFVAPYHIDYPAMTIYLRSAVGEKGWAKFVERFGIPPVILTMPQDIPSDQVDSWRRSAEKVAEGGSGAVPFGTNVNFCDGARGINPFKDFIHNQRELVVLMSTGGLLTSLTEAGSGTLAGGAHSDTWAEVRRMDSAKIGSVLNRTLADTILDRAFPGRPHLAYFAFDTEAVPSPGEVFDDATKAKNAGYLIDQADLEERTGYKLVKDESPAPQPGFAAPITNKAPDGRAQTPAAPQKKTAEDLLADALAEAMSEELQKNKSPDASAQPDAVKNAITNPCPKCHRQMSADGTCTSCAKRASNHTAGKAAWAKAVADKADVLDAMERDSIGKIDFIWGHPGTPSKNYEDGEGVSHVLAKHKVDAGMITGVLAYGDILEDPAGDKYYAIKKRNLVVLRKREGRNSYVISGYVKNDPHKVKELRDRCKLIEKGE